MVSWNCKFNLKVLPSYYYFLFYQHWQFLLKWTVFYIIQNQTWQRCFLWGPTQELLLLCRFVKKHSHHMTLKILIGRFSRNFFSRTAEGIELKSGIYVPMNVFNMCCYCWHHLKIQNGHQRRSKFALKPYGKQHFHLLLENSRTEFNQTWQRCFLWGPKKLSWFVLTRPTHWVLSLLCIGQFVMPIILTWVLFCSKCAELLLDQEKQRVTI